LTEFAFSVEGLSPQLLAAYAASGMERGKSGAPAIQWALDNNENAFCVARSNGKIVGIFSYIKSRMKFGSNYGVGYQAVDSYVSPEVRGQGLFTQLAKTYATHLQNEAADLVWGFPNDNAAPAWFGKLGWTKFGQTPFLIKPLRAGYFLRKFHLFGDFPVSFGQDQDLQSINATGEWVDEAWDRFSAHIGCATIRDQSFLNHRLFDCPQRSDYRVVANENSTDGALVATREAHKHGGKIAYLMEAFGGPSLCGVLTSEMARLRGNGTELALAWAYPWSPNYKALRRCGFVPLPERLRPITIWFGAMAFSSRATSAMDPSSWYLSYLDSDTV
jgi:GNAT superfamily N-acetyltransferase